MHNWVRLLCVVLAIVSAPVQAAVVYVSANGTDTAGCGTVMGTAACRSVSYAMEDIASDGDTVAIEPVPGSNATSTVFSESQTISAFPSGLTVTTAVPGLMPVIRCTAPVRLFEISGATVLTLAEVLVSGCGSGVYDDTQLDGGVVLAQDNARVVLTASTLVHNAATNGGVVALSDAARATFSDCTFWGNAVNGSGGVVYATGSAVVDMQDSVTGDPSDVYPHCTAMDPSFPAAQCVNTTVLRYNASLPDDEQPRLYHVGTFTEENAQCAWELEVPEGNGLRIDFCDQHQLLYFLDPCDGSDDHILTVTDLVSGHVLYSGCDVMKPIQAPSHRVRVSYRFLTDTLVFSSTFQATFRPVRGNTAGVGGVGGVVAAENDATVTLRNVSAYSSSAGNGGVVSVADASSLHIVDSSLVAAVGNWGGAILATNATQVTVLGSTIAASIGDYGGGIAVLDSSVANVVDSVVSKSLAVEGGGMYVWRPFRIACCFACRAAIGFRCCCFVVALLCL